MTNVFRSQGESYVYVYIHTNIIGETEMQKNRKSHIQKKRKYTKKMGWFFRMAYFPEFPCSPELLNCTVFQIFMSSSFYGPSRCPRVFRVSCFLWITTVFPNLRATPDFFKCHFLPISIFFVFFGTY